jgi:protein disulfide-isomerase
MTASFAFIASLILGGSQQAYSQINWQSQLKTAHAQAQAEGKLLLLHFYDDNCVWCDRLEAGAFQSPEVASAIEKNFVPVKIHAGRNPTIASTFKVSRFPTDVIVTPQGQALTHTVSPQDPSRYVAMLAQSLQGPEGAANGTMVAGATPPAEAAPQPSYASTPPASEPSSSVAPSSPAGQIVATPVSSVTRTTSSQPKASGTDLELAMDGFCAVTVVEKDQWVEGNPQLGVVHLGRLYLFSDKAAMDKFLANPEPYTPVLNGIDVVRFFEERKIVPGNREWGLKDPDHNRMFFFADEAALNHFYDQHARYTEAALQVMSKAVKDANP